MDIPDGWETDTVHANGIEFRYYRTGEGPPVVMLHGFYENGRCWKPLAEDIDNDYDVVMYDARGHGLSDAPEKGYEIEDRIKDLVEFINALDLDEPILIGHSMGGSTAAWTASTHPDIPRGVVLEDPAGMYSPEIGPHERERIAREKVREWEERSLEAIASEHEERESDLARCIAVAKKECSPHIANIAREGYPPLKNAFEDIDCPTLVLKSDADSKTRATDLEIAEKLENGKLVHIPGAGHCVFRDEYEEAYKELRTFLKRL